LSAFTLSSSRTIVICGVAFAWLHFNYTVSKEVIHIGRVHITDVD
jgi:hypothetical protein